MRSAAAALDAARPLVVRLDERGHPEDTAADLIEAWAAVEDALRAMAGPGAAGPVGAPALGGQALVSEVRARGLLDYPHAHALLGFLAARDRATRPDYLPTAEDVAAARAGFQAIEAAQRPGGAPVLPPAAALPAPAGPPAGRPAAPAGAPVLPPPAPPAVPRAGRGVPLGGSPNGAPVGAPNSSGSAAPAAARPPAPPGARAARTPLLAGGAALLLGALGWGGYRAYGEYRARAALDDGVAAYRAGQRAPARAALERAAALRPAAALPRVYLARLAREDGDVRRATALLDTAIRLEPANPTALREMGQLQLYANRPQLAIAFFTRAIPRDTTDRVAQGWLACALSKVGDAAAAERFYARAGAGDWTACRQAAPAAVGPGRTPGAGPGAAAAGSYPPVTAAPAAAGGMQPLAP